MARYIIDPLNGIDNQSGLEGHPWKTLNKGSLTAIAGDFVILRGGIYALGDGGACLRTHNHGQLAAPITFQRYSSENPILKNQGIGIFLDNNYIIFDGLSVINDNQATGMIRGCEASGDPNDVTKNKHHITLKNCTFRNMSIDPNNVSFGIDWQFVSYGRIQTCTIDHVGRPSNVGTESGNGIGLAGGYNIIEDCLIDIGTHKYLQRFGLVVDDDPDYDSYYEVEVYHYREGDVIFSDINEISCDEYLDHYSKGTVIESYDQQQEN